MSVYKGLAECARCGCGSEYLPVNDENLPILVAHLGNTVKLRCQICGYIWLQKPEARNDVR